jgi:hypothetical protein
MITYTFGLKKGMKAFLSFFLSAGLLLACANDPKTSSEATASAGEVPGAMAMEAPQTAEPGPADQTSASARGAESEEPPIGVRPPSPPPQSGQVLVLKAQGGKAPAGSQACVEVKVQGFVNLLSMQYTMAWDAEVLTYQGVGKPGLPGLSNQNFGAHRTAEGLLTFVWIDGSLRGVTLPDDSTIFSVCFDVVGKAGAASPFRFIEQPTPFESVNLAEQLVEIKTVEGAVKVE